MNPEALGALLYQMLGEMDVFVDFYVVHFLTTLTSNFIFQM